MNVGLFPAYLHSKERSLEGENKKLLSQNEQLASENRQLRNENLTLKDANESLQFKVTQLQELLVASQNKAAKYRTLYEGSKTTPVSTAETLEESEDKAN